MSDWSVIKDPTTLQEREKAASLCVSTLKFPFTTVMDDMKDTVATTYAAWPERLFVIDREGKIAYNGAPGPFGFWPSKRYEKKPPMRFPPGIQKPKASLETFLESFFAPSPPAKKKQPEKARRSS